jgi:hypothetical protein
MCSQRALTHHPTHELRPARNQSPLGDGMPSMRCRYTCGPRSCGLENRDSQYGSLGLAWNISGSSRLTQVRQSRQSRARGYKYGYRSDQCKPARIDEYPQQALSVLSVDIKSARFHTLYSYFPSRLARYARSLPLFSGTSIPPQSIEVQCFFAQ